MIFSRSPGEKPPVRASAAKRSRIGFLAEIRGMKKVIVDAAQITRMRNSRRWIILLRLTVVSFFAPYGLGRGGLVATPRRGVATRPPDVLLGRLQLCDHQQTSVRPEGAVGAAGYVSRSWPVGPVGLVVGDAMQPLNDRDVDRVFPVDLHQLHRVGLELRIVRAQRRHL